MGYSRAPAMTPVAKNKNRLDHIDPAKPSTPYFEALIHNHVQAKASKYGQGNRIHWVDLNCQYMMYQCPTDPIKNKLTAAAIFDIFIVLH
jgi:hypothetical protein